MRIFEERLVLSNQEVGLNPTSEELARTILARMGLEPRKKGSTEKMHKTLLEMYERTKVSYRDKTPESSIMTVEEMALFAGISRQTMYDYLGRWLSINLISKATYIKENKVIIGYKLNGPTLEAAFEKTQMSVRNHLELTNRYIRELQKTIKNDKISDTQKLKSCET